MDTIFAQATAPGKAGVAIIRLSGPSSWQAVERLCGSRPEPRVATLKVLKGPDGVLDQALEYGQEEGSGFTSAGLGQTQDVSACHGTWNCLFLDLVLIQWRV